MSIFGKLKRYMPMTLFGRALMILVLPVILVQLFTIYIFYERHWDSIVRNMSSSLVGDTTVLLHHFGQAPKVSRVEETASIGDMLGIGVTFDTSQERVFERDKGKETYPEFFKQLARRTGAPFMVQRSGIDQDIMVSIQLADGTLELFTSKKRLVSSTTYIFILWMISSSIIILFIATLFLRNQIRPIRQLARAAERFGLGQDTPDFRPRGAAEVRQAGRAFITMRNRIMRQVTTRTEMLAGISHDLRTPLTRMKLQLAMAGLKDKDKSELESDVEEMEYMIQEYLDFARGEGKEKTQYKSMQDYIGDIVDNYLRHEKPVDLVCGADITMEIRPNAMKRAIQNVIDNALYYGGSAHIRVYEQAPYVYVSVEDEGEGIPEEEHELVFRPFKRLDPSRNSETGGAGLGLSITRDIIQSHGGTVTLANRDEGGLRVTMKLPIIPPHPTVQ